MITGTIRAHSTGNTAIQTPLQDQAFITPREPLGKAGRQAAGTLGQESTLHSPCCESGQELLISWSTQEGPSTQGMGLAGQSALPAATRKPGGVTCTTVQKTPLRPIDGSTSPILPTSSDVANTSKCGQQAPTLTGAVQEMVGALENLTHSAITNLFVKIGETLSRAIETTLSKVQTLSEPGAAGTAISNTPMHAQPSSSGTTNSVVDPLLTLVSQLSEEMVQRAIQAVSQIAESVRLRTEGTK